MASSSARSYLHADSVELAEEEGLLKGRGGSERANAVTERPTAQQVGNCSRRHILAACGGAVVLSLCAVVAVTGNGISSDAVPSATGRQLLESSELHAATADMFTKLGSARHLPPRELRDKVASAYSHYASLNPQASRLLGAVHFDSRQRQHIVKMVQDISDPNTQLVGRTLAEAVQRGKPGGSEAVRRELEDVYRRRGFQLRKLSEETLPSFMRTSSDEAGRLKLNIVLSERWHASAMVQPARRLFFGSNSSVPVDSATQAGIEKAVNLIGDLVLEAATLLTDVDTVCDAFSKLECDEHISPMVKAGIDATSTLAGLANCFDAADNKKGTSTGEFNQVIFGVCAAQYATQVMQMAEMAEKMMSGGGSSGGQTTLATTVAPVQWAWDNER